MAHGTGTDFAVLSVPTARSVATTMQALATPSRRVIYALYDDHVSALLSEAVSHTEHLRLGLACSPTDEALSE